MAFGKNSETEHPEYRSFKLAVLLVLAVGLLGCHYSPVQVASSLGPVNPYKKYEILPKVSGESCTFKLLYLIPFGEEDRVANALHAAVPLGMDVDDITGVMIEEKTTIYIIGAEHCVIVSGYPIRYNDTQGAGGIFSHEKNPRLVLAPPPAPAAPVAVAPAPAPGVRAPERAPAPRTTSGPAIRSSARKPPPQPAPRREDPVSTNEQGQQVLDCGVLCGDYARPLRDQSSVVHGIIFKRCTEKCNAGNIPFIECAMDAKTTSDVTRCNQL